jgi:aryl-alcohol dehydrogenase-like predicted oxidoreductase
MIGQLTLAWILAEGDDFVGTTKIKNLEENAAAAQITISKQEVKEIRQACEKADVQDERYSATMSANL